MFIVKKFVSFIVRSINDIYGIGEIGGGEVIPPVDDSKYLQGRNGQNIEDRFDVIVELR